jgi:hypothetical protein
MLEGLDAVNWSSLTHAYGDATDVPGHLRSLLSADPKVRDETMDELFSNICHQGTVYPATAAAVPFLYELLTAPDVQDKLNIAHLLACIADGVGYLEAHTVGDEATWRKILGKRGKTLEQELEREASQTNAVRRAASTGLHHLLPYLNGSDAQIRWCVAVALANYPEHHAWSLPAIDAALTSETDEDVRKALVESKARLTKRCT